jgi:hypothetical protein
MFASRAGPLRAALLPVKLPRSSLFGQVARRAL